MEDRHAVPRPDSCDICAYTAPHPEVDHRLEHTLTMIAQSILISDLEKAPAPKPLRAIAQSSIGFPGPQIPIEPRHWYWALMQFPDARISLAPEEERQWKID